MDRNDFKSIKEQAQMKECHKCRSLAFTFSSDYQSDLLACIILLLYDRTAEFMDLIGQKAVINLL